MATIVQLPGAFALPLVVGCERTGAHASGSGGELTGYVSGRVASVRPMERRSVLQRTMRRGAIPAAIGREGAAPRGAQLRGRLTLRMAQAGPTPPPERAETDASLPIERSTTDEELAAQRAWIDESADHVVELARERAEALVRTTRERTDSGGGEDAALTH